MAWIRMAFTNALVKAAECPEVAVSIELITLEHNTIGRSSLLDI